MANGFPVRNMRRSTASGRSVPPPPPVHIPPPPPPPPPEPAPKPPENPGLRLPFLSGEGLTLDRDTLLILGLLWLLYQEHADPKLLLALAYILL